MQFIRSLHFNSFFANTSFCVFARVTNRYDQSKFIKLYEMLLIPFLLSTRTAYDVQRLVWLGLAWRGERTKPKLQPNYKRIRVHSCRLARKAT